jgi:hypothetical protein
VALRCFESDFIGTVIAARWAFGCFWPVTSCGSFGVAYTRVRLDRSATVFGCDEYPRRTKKPVPGGMISSPRPGYSLSRALRGIDEPGQLRFRYQSAAPPRSCWSCEPRAARSMADVCETNQEPGAPQLTLAVSHAKAAVVEERDAAALASNELSFEREPLLQHNRTDSVPLSHQVLILSRTPCGGTGGYRPRGRNTMILR